MIHYFHFNSPQSYSGRSVHLSTLILFGPNCFYLVHFVHFGLFISHWSYSVHCVHFGPNLFIRSYSVYFSPIKCPIWSPLVQFGLLCSIWSNSVYFHPLRSFFVHLHNKKIYVWVKNTYSKSKFINCNMGKYIFVNIIIRSYLLLADFVPKFLITTIFHVFVSFGLSSFGLQEEKELKVKL